MLRHLRPLRGWAGSQLRRPAKDRAGKTIASRFGDGRERRLPGWDAVCVRFRAKRTLVQTRRMTESDPEQIAPEHLTSRQNELLRPILSKT